MNKTLFKMFMTPLGIILQNKLFLMKEYGLTEDRINNMPYWQFEETVKICNELKPFKAEDLFF